MVLSRLLPLGIFSIMMLTLMMFYVPQLALAADDGASATSTISQGLDAAAEDVYETELTATKFIGNLIRILLAATGIVFLLITVYAGIMYITAMGDDNKIKKAKSMLTSSVIGLIIIIGAYAISSYVVDALISASKTTTK